MQKDTRMNERDATLLDAFRLDGQVAAVTGAARGIGYETARLFVAAGARVVLLDQDEAAAAERRRDSEAAPRRRAWTSRGKRRWSAPSKPSSPRTAGSTCW